MLTFPDHGALSRSLRQVKAWRVRRLRAARGLHDRAQALREHRDALRTRQTTQSDDLRDPGPQKRRASVSKTDLVYWRISPEHVDRDAQPGFVAPDIRFETLQTREDGELLCVGKRKRSAIELPRPNDMVMLYERPEAEAGEGRTGSGQERFFLWARRRYMLISVSEISCLLAEFVLRRM
ncbi:hypothetical protein CYMTET_37061 [Cymbomonas tetramitiformis]|uniref:Uncharacterized protein n=1 Tax=Cymbomonas tetramitiformis TaxID=36881 RepID=A0AAE0CEU9_9CHLO|nr:hypothetical protein CYMTET_37061 [Cymbomonas tetramitiformis]